MSEFIECKTCKAKNGIRRYIQETAVPLMKYRAIGRFIGGVHPQTVKHHLERMIEEGTVFVSQFECGCEQILSLSPPHSGA